MTNTKNGSEMRALIVDDDALFRAILAHQLNTLGLMSEELDSGTVVVERLAEGQFDVLFLDIVMDGKEGIETIMDLQALDQKPPVVAVSSQEIYLRSALAMGADRVLLKPIFPDQLSALLADLSLLNDSDLRVIGC